MSKKKKSSRTAEAVVTEKDLKKETEAGAIVSGEKDSAEDGEKKEYQYTGRGEQTLVSDIMLAERELDELKEKYGVQEEEKGIKKAVSGFFDRKDAFSQIPIKKKTYVRLALFLGAFGGHRFYTKQYPSAILYLLTCWTGYSLAMTMVDLLIAVPKKADENGCIYL